MPHSEKPIYYAYLYVRARIAYDPDNIDAIESARSWMPSLTYLVDNSGEPELAHYGGVLASEINAFRKELYERYDICKRREFEGTIPYVGMEERDLKYTDWGKPYREVTSGFAGEYTRYYFKVDDSICSVVASDVRNYRIKHNEHRVVILVYDII